MDNRKKSGLNLIIGILSEIISIVLGVVVPRLFITSFGSEMNGFLSTISQIFAYFALLEAGVGGATVQALYKPIANNDKREISSIINATSKYYNKTGIIYLILVFLLSCIYPLMVSSSIPYLTMMLIILFNGIPNVIAYLFQAKFILIMQCEGKNYINVAITSISTTFISLSKVVFILLNYNILIVQLAYLIISLLKIFVISLYIKKHYYWIDSNIEPNYESINQKNSVLINQICDLIFRNTDLIILSIFAGLKEVSVYSMYAMIYGLVRTALNTISISINFALGQVFNTNKKKYIHLMDFFETYRYALVYSLFNITFVLILPFMKLYTSGIEDINYVDFYVALLFVVYMLMTESRACEANTISFAQHFKKTQWRCILEALINIIVTLSLVNFIGIYGVLLGTIVALIYRMNDMIIYSNVIILGRSPLVVYKKLIINASVFVILSIIGFRINWNIDSYLSFFISALLWAIPTILIYLLINSITDIKSFKELKKYISSFLKRRGKI